MAGTDFTQSIASPGLHLAMGVGSRCVQHEKISCWNDGFYAMDCADLVGLNARIAVYSESDPLHQDDDFTCSDISTCYVVGFNVCVPSLGLPSTLNVVFHGSMYLAEIPVSTVTVLSILSVPHHG
ncbi:TPA: hypothetical protein ONA41_006372 [Pseudomonas aeruginosa]|nr:hypothetical protein [Pseudomonas aeruginosa]